MKLKRNTRLLGNGRLSSTFSDDNSVFVYIADRNGIVGKKFNVNTESLTGGGRVSYAEDFYNLGFVEAERRLTIKSVIR